MADVMNCRVVRIEISKSAALGAALLAAHGWLVQAGRKTGMGGSGCRIYRSDSRQRGPSGPEGRARL